MIVLEKNTLFHLSQEDQVAVGKLSMCLEKQGRAYFRENHKADDKRTFYEMNVHGFGAESAFCRQTNSPIDLTCNEKENHFKKPDTILPDGRSVDIKQTYYRDGHLLLREEKAQIHHDIYALMYGVFPFYRFYGWIEYERFILPGNRKQWKSGISYTLHHTKLNSKLKIKIG